MESHIDADFRKAYRKLPKEARDQARKAYGLFKQDPYHPSLQFKRVHSKEPVYSVRSSLNYRALGGERRRCYYLVLDRPSFGI